MTTSAGSMTLAGLVARQLVVGRGEPVAGVAVGLQPAHGVGERVHRVSIHREGPYRGPGGIGTGCVAACGAVIVVAGEALVDLVVSGDSVTAAPGGAPYNVARGCARLGAPTALLATLSTDAFGQRLAAGLAESGVDGSLLQHSERPTTLAVAAARRRRHGHVPLLHRGHERPVADTRPAARRRRRLRHRWARPRARADGHGDREHRAGRRPGRRSSSSTSTAGRRRSTTVTPTSPGCGACSAAPTWSRPATRTSPTSTRACRSPRPPSAARPTASASCW